MRPAQPVFFTTPDGIEREVRFGFRQQKAIVERYGDGMNIVAVLNKYGDSVLPELLFMCLAGRGGKPPEGLTEEQLMDDLDLDQSADVMATLLCAAKRGKVEKKMIEEAIRKGDMKEVARLTGSISGLSLDSNSDSQTMNSGTSPSESLSPSSTDSRSESEPGTSEAV